ncbi:MAG: tolB protein precursor, partial [Sphingobacteriaceae bacterium]|nr:tolB protein precursor [Sphingobacteriaceae bacterium]
MRNSIFKYVSISLIFWLSSTIVQAQYFGQNRVRYKNEKFKVLQTPNFEIYHYLKNEKLINKLAQDAETWYKMHQEVFRDTFAKKNPIILYSNHPDFQQTTALNGEVGVGTGGVTEALKNRVIMPVLSLNNQTRHVLGHELVHAFQYHTLLEKDSLSLENVGRVPLWMVEGMAEYLSIGKKDAFTSMWMRDAMLNRDIPSLKDLTNSNKYFPYRYGQAFWTFIGSVYGDSTIVPLFKATARFGYEDAIKYTFGYDDKTLSGLWKNEIETHYRPFLKADSTQIKIIGQKIIDNKNGGNMNLAPAISPDGKYIAFLSEKDMFGIDLFLADAKTGRIIRKLSSQISNSHIDDYNFLESAGAWSPDGKQFAFSIFSGGKNQMLIIDIKTGKTVLQTDMGKVAEFSNLSWSPNGEEIAFSGLIEGQSDIFSFHLKTKVITNITNDEYSDYAPNYSPDGTKIAFSSDRAAVDADFKEAIYPLNISIYDFNTQSISNLPVFKNANNLNAQFSGDSKRLFFLSNKDGFRNLYEYSFKNNTVKQLTDYFTGISGITEFSPALSVSLQDDIVYSYYRNQRYTLYNAPAETFNAKEIDTQESNQAPAMLPPYDNSNVSSVNTNLLNFNNLLNKKTDSLNYIPYKAKFSLDYIANSGVGVAASRFGTGLQGGVMAMFSDILGRNQIIANLAINGEIYDFGGLAAYINQASRINWGIAFSHTPFLAGYSSFGVEKINVNGKEVEVLNRRTDMIRTFEDQAQFFTSYPFNKVHRVELGTAFSLYSYRLDRFSNYFDSFGNYIGADRSKLSAEQAQKDYGSPFNSFKIFQFNTAFVGDNSIQGIAAPLDGFRYRLGLESNFGDFKFNTLTVDFRKYVRLKPITLAFRTYNYLRMGKGGENLFPLFIGFPTFVRGYEANSFNNSNVDNSSINQLSGSKIAVM